VVHVTTCYQITDRKNPHTDMGLWHDKIPVDVVSQKDENLWAIDSRIAPIEGEQVLIKKRASAFHGTYLAGYLRAAGVEHASSSPASRPRPACARPSATAWPTASAPSP
jgi:N-carbamoylsarcosine amidase